jgi:hypothetical protein
MLDFPSSPSNAQVYNSPNGTSWIWDGAKWTSAAFTGVTIDTHYRNRIINGDMSVDQRHGGAVYAATNGYVIDRWAYVGQGIGNIGQVALGAGPGGGIAATGLQYMLQWATTTAHTVAATDNTQFYHGIEACNFNDANWGTASAQPVTLEFWALSSLTGVFAGSLQNGTSARSYVFTYSIPTANIWTKIRLNIPGDTAGTWNVASNLVAAWLEFNLGFGSTYSHAAGAWAAGNFSTAPGAVNPVATLNATFWVTGVALMVGAAAVNAEPEFKKYSDNLIDCCRYFVNSNPVYTYGYAVGAGSFLGCAGHFPQTMRAAPTLTLQSSATGNCATPTVDTPSVLGFRAWSQGTAAGGTNFTGLVTADADF